jgi:hypothetical protein
MIGSLDRILHRTVAVLNEFLIPGPWTRRDGRRAHPLPIRLGLYPPKNARLRSFIDRGRGWKPFNLDRVPDRIDGEGWWGDPEIVVPIQPEVLLEKAWRKVRLGAWKPQKTRPAPALPRPGLKGRPLVSILIPTTGQTVWTLRGPVDIVANCVWSIREKSTYDNYEIIVSHNGPAPCSVPMIPYIEPGPFNLARKINFMIRHSKGDHLILLNDDTEVIEPGWIEALLEFAQEPDVGVVGGRLYYPDGRIQHAGAVFGYRTLLGCAHVGHPYDCPEAAYPREFSAMIGACMMIRRGEFLDEAFPHAWDADYCLRMRSRGLRVVYTPHARLFHHESVSLKPSGPSYFHELLRFRCRWPGCLPDPFHVKESATCRHHIARSRATSGGPIGDGGGIIC